MSLLNLANELLLATVHFLDSERDIDALARCNKRLYSLLIVHLYRFNVRHSYASGLIWAAKWGRLETLKRAIAAGVRMQDHALLPTAAEHGHEACVRLLLTTPGIDINVKNEQGWTAVAAASRQGHVNVVKSLLVADPDLQTNYAGWSPLNVAAGDGRTEVVTLLLAKGADVSNPSDTGWTPLKSAACNGHYDVVKLLLAHGAGVHATAERLWTPLHSAASSGHSDIVELLLSYGASTSAVTVDGWTPLALAADRGHVDAVKVLVAKTADVNLSGGNGWTPITLASDSGHVEIVRILLESGADVNSSCDNGWAPLRLAAGAGNVGILNLLLAHGADITATNDSGWSALLIATEKGQRDAVEALLCHGADHSTTNQCGLTALHLACENGNVDIVNLLLASGADYTMGNKSGWGPVHIAARNNHSKLVELFLRVIPGFDFNVQDHNGRTAFHHAVMRGNADVVDVFLSHGASSSSTTIPDWYGSLPIYAAIRNGHEAVTRRLLAANNYSSCPVDCFGHDLLAWAKRSGSLELVQLVRQHVQPRDVTTIENVSEDEPDVVDETPPAIFVEDACWCEVCTRCTVLGTVSYECPACDGGYFLVCAECHAAGVGCRDGSHVLIPHRCNRVV
ncbi:hypothetical protein E4U21_007473 [Claviceps maximensis]|nr:hypothetical protein E4U21_007473 [Claviceps maximensis]